MSAPLLRNDAAEKAKKVRLFLVDVDGVLTDGGIVYDGGGREIKRFHVRDGHGIKMLQRAGVEVGIITGRTSEVVAFRARELGVSLVRQGTWDKVSAWREILAEKGFLPEETAYVGDDIVDMPLMSRWFAAGRGRRGAAVLEAADFVSARPGGQGAVREIIEFVLRSSGAWEKIVSKYFADGA
jgi:3-deoxy-D-manno-octulosonate 8-phosphate phosphatase (KDO 8-P phosphatase)